MRLLRDSQQGLHQMFLPPHLACAAQPCFGLTEKGQHVNYELWVMTDLTVEITLTSARIGVWWFPFELHMFSRFDPKNVTCAWRKSGAVWARRKNGINLGFKWLWMPTSEFQHGLHQKMPPWSQANCVTNIRAMTVAPEAASARITRITWIRRVAGWKGVEDNLPPWSWASMAGKFCSGSSRTIRSQMKTNKGIPQNFRVGEVWRNQRSMVW